MKAINRKLFRRYQAGYEVWNEDHVLPPMCAEVISEGAEPDDADEMVEAINAGSSVGELLHMKVAYTPSGDCIGNPKTAHLLCKKRGIAPEKISPDHNVCSIGFSEAEQKWYGWSHRAIHGFGIGSEVKPGDIAYQPSDAEDFRLDCIRFWDDEYHTQTIAFETVDDGLRGVKVQWTYDESVPNEKLRSQIGGVFCPFPETFGRGSWMAETLDDAKQMAIDFANDIA